MNTDRSPMAPGFPEFSVARHRNSGAPNRFPHAHHPGLPRTLSLRRRRYTPEPRVSAVHRSPPSADEGGRSATLGDAPKKHIPYAEGVTQQARSNANGLRRTALPWDAYRVAIRRTRIAPEISQTSGSAATQPLPTRNKPATIQYLRLARFPRLFTPFLGCGRSPRYVLRPARRRRGM